MLSNPWTIEDDDAAPPPEAIRGHYRRRLSDPAALLRLLTGKGAIPTVQYGPGDAALAHGPHEHVRVDEVATVAHVLARLALDPTPLS